MPSLVMLVGLPASGKSTFRTEYLEKHPGTIVVSSDDYIDAKAAELGLPYSAIFDQYAKDADKHCRAVYAEAIENGCDILIDRTNMTPKGRRSFLATLPKTYTRNAHCFNVASHILLARLKDRAEATGKHIPISVVENMRKSYVEPTLDEFDAIWLHNFGQEATGTWGAAPAAVAPITPSKNPLSPAAIARVAHEANRAFCASIGDTSQPSWDDAPDWQKFSAIDGVNYHSLNPDALPSDTHQSWLDAKERDGWVWGMVKDADRKEHPCMVPYDDLPLEQRSKDYVFSAIVKTMLRL